MFGCLVSRRYDGTVEVQAPDVNLSETITPLPQRFAQDTTLLSNQCASRLREGSVSSFVERGREDVATSPDGILPRRLDRMTLDHVDKTNAAGLPTLSQPSGRRWASLERDALGVRPMQVGSVNLPVTNCDRP